MILHTKIIFSKDDFFFLFQVNLSFQNEILVQTQFINLY